MQVSYGPYCIQFCQPLLDPVHQNAAQGYFHIPPFDLFHQKAADIDTGKYEESEKKEKALRDRGNKSEITETGERWKLSISIELPCACVCARLDICTCAHLTVCVCVIV